MRMEELNSNMLPPLSILTMGEHYLGDFPTDADDPTAIQAFLAVEGIPGMVDELRTMDEPGVLPESKPTGTGWQVIRLDSLTVPSKEEFDAATVLELGMDPSTMEPRTVEKELIRYQIWFGSNPLYPGSDDPCVRFNQSFQRVRSTGQACQFYDRWVNDLVARAEVQQLFIP